MYRTWHAISDLNFIIVMFQGYIRQTTMLFFCAAHLKNGKNFYHIYVTKIIISADIIMSYVQKAEIIQVSNAWTPVLDNI